MNESSVESICHRCGTRMMFARELRRLGPSAPALRVYVCTDCAAVHSQGRINPNPLRERPRRSRTRASRDSAWREDFTVATNEPRAA